MESPMVIKRWGLGSDGMLHYFLISGSGRFSAVSLIIRGSGGTIILPLNPSAVFLKVDY